MLAPLLAWAVTGAIFFIKPGYGGAYESLAVRTYPLEAAAQVPAQRGWREARYLQTALGPHVLARTADGWKQIDPATGGERPAPDETQLRRLLDDALTGNTARYGRIVSIDGLVATTDTGVRITLDWNRLSLSQRGRDTDRIDAIYRVHYLQWTGIETVDKVLGAAGLLLLVALSVVGISLIRR